MSLLEIPYTNLRLNPHDLFENQWLILTCGDFEKKDFNGMTIAWGSLGTMWHRPFVQVVVRPTRYTFDFMNRYDQFTVCAFPELQKKANIAPHCKRNQRFVKTMRIDKSTRTVYNAPVQFAI